MRRLSRQRTTRRREGCATHRTSSTTCDVGGEIAVVVAARALVEIDRWWRENRPAAPNLLLEEFAAALQMISNAPFVGRRYPDKPIPDVRRLLMRATRYHVYYVVGMRKWWFIPSGALSEAAARI